MSPAEHCRILTGEQMATILASIRAVDDPATLMPTMLAAVDDILLPQDGHRPADVTGTPRVGPGAWRIPAPQWDVIVAAAAHAFRELAHRLATAGDICATGEPAVEVIHPTSRPQPATACVCPPGCPFCAAPVGAAHDPRCRWQPQTNARQPRPAATAVAADHIHRPGCRRLRRHPGPLFIPAERCTFCGAYDTAQRQQFDSFGGTTEGFEECTNCGQQWGWADLTAIL